MSTRYGWIGLGLVLSTIVACSSEPPKPAAVTAAPAPAPPPEPRVKVYVTNEASGDLTVIDGERQTVIGTVSARQAAARDQGQPRWQVAVRGAERIAERRTRRGSERRCRRPIAAPTALAKSTSRHLQSEARHPGRQRSGAARHQRRRPAPVCRQRRRRPGQRRRRRRQAT